MVGKSGNNWNFHIVGIDTVFAGHALFFFKYTEKTVRPTLMFEFSSVRIIESQLYFEFQRASI